MSLNYSQYVAELQNLVAETTPVPSSDFTAIIPGTVDYAEQRLYRELDLLSTVVRDQSATVTANSRTFNLPQSLGRFVVVHGINIVTPSSASVSTGTRNPVVKATTESVDSLWPSETAASADTYPTIYGMVTDQQLIFGPPPGAAFAVEVLGTIRPNPISASNTTTYLSLYLPDLFIAASMIFLSGWLRNFGSQADTPQMAQSWQAQYDLLFKSAIGEEHRKKYGSWVSQSMATQVPA